MIDDVENLQGADINISYDPAKVSYVSHANGDILPLEFPDPPLCEEGLCNFIAVRTGASFSGSGTILTITWEAEADGTSPIDILNSTLMSDPDGSPVQFSLQDGSVVVGTPSPTGSITAHVFHDDNSNGVADPGEPGLPGWTVTLYDDLDCIGPQITSDETDENGDVVFTNLTASSYSVGQTPQDGHVITTPTCVDVFLTGGEEAMVSFGNAEQESVVVPLLPMWNVAEWQAPLCLPIDEAVANLTDEGVLNVVALFVAQTQSWLLFDPAVPPAINTLEELCHEDIVWLNVDEAIDWVQGP
jgi:hypothetical protein